MELSSIPQISDRPRIKRMNQRELRDTQTAINSDSPSMNRWASSPQNQASPQQMIPWQPNPRPLEDLNNTRKNKCYINRTCFILFGVIFCLILIVGIVGIVLGIVLPTTTSSPDEQLTPKMARLNDKTVGSSICSNRNHESTVILNESFPSEWTQYSYNYSATKITSEILFSFETESTYVFYLDMISVVVDHHQTLPSELLNNSDFQNSTTNTTLSTKLCPTACICQIVSGSQCFQETRYCFMITCPIGNSSLIFLSQSFQTIIGKIYTISFMINHPETSSFGKSSLYIDVI